MQTIHSIGYIILMVLVFITIGCNCSRDDFILKGNNLTYKHEYDIEIKKIIQNRLDKDYFIDGYSVFIGKYTAYTNNVYDGPGLCKMYYTATVTNTSNNHKYELDDTVIRGVLFGWNIAAESLKDGTFDVLVVIKTNTDNVGLNHTTIVAMIPMCRIIDK